jgi:hypothetical protein
MANFNYKKYLTENKLTQTTKLRAGILAEGQFSWMTQDTNQQIGSQEENTIPVYMYDNEGNSYYESNYDGYGEFGGVDYYELLDKMNGGDGDRSRGINLAFEKIKTDSEILYPALVTKPDFNFKSHDFTQQPKNDPNQSWYMEPEEEDYNGEDDYDYSNDYDDNEGDGYIDDNDSEYDTGVDESKKKYYKDAEEDDADHIKALEKDMKDDKKSSKMKRSELKEKIKEMALAEININNPSENNNLADFLSEIENMLNEAEEEVAVDDTEVAADGEENIDVDTTTEVDPNVKAVQDALTQAQAAAQKLGDPKLTDQIGNTITFFTRAHVVEKGAVAEGEEMEDNRKILDQVRNELLGLFQPYGNFQISDMTMKGQNLGTEFRLYSKSKGADWKGLENFMKNNSDFSIKNISKQTFDNPKSIDFSYKKSSNLNENTSLSPVNLTKQNFDKIENSPLSKEYEGMFSILDNLISKYPEFKKKDIYDYFKLLAIDKYFNPGYLVYNQWRKKDVAEDLNEVLQNDDLIQERMLDIDQEQLVSMILSFAENNPSTTLVDYLNNEFGYNDDDEDSGYQNAAGGISHLSLPETVSKTKDLNESMFPMLKKILK